MTILRDSHMVPGLTEGEQEQLQSSGRLYVVISEISNARPHPAWEYVRAALRLIPRRLRLARSRSQQVSPIGRAKSPPNESNLLHG